MTQYYMTLYIRMRGAKSCETGHNVVRRHVRCDVPIDVDACSFFLCMHEPSE